MKHILQPYALSLAIIIMLSLLVSLIMGTLFFFHITDTTFTTMSIWLLGIFIYFIAGLIFAKHTQKKILIHVIIIISITLSIYFIFIPLQSFDWIRIICKLLAFFIAIIIVQNKKGH